MKLGEFSKKVSEIIPSIHIAVLKSQPELISKTALTLQQLMLMETLRFMGPSKMSDVAKFLGVTKSAVTGLTDRLIKGKYVRRVSAKDDRRVIKLELTPKGKEFAEKMAEHRLDMIRKLFSNINEKDRAHYVDILLKIKQNIDQEERTK
ncbi:MAG: MarR family transcriptional regulator [Candidatus Omnitrophica bacterium]|nr:MarR family transcriptional regulator [Candidatus Omnitrophota bacterium]